DRPAVVIWEPTRACDLACLHCRATAQPKRSNFELSTYEGYKLIDQIAELAPPTFILTGGDPLKRSDIFEFINYAARRGLRTTLTPSATPLLTRDAIKRMLESGLARISLTLDGSTPESHDGHRGIPGHWQLTVDAARWAAELALPVEITTTVTKQNQKDLEAMAGLLTRLGISVWSLFFSVTGARGKTSDMVTAWEAEEIFGRMYQLSKSVPFEIEAPEAGHYRRFVLQQLMTELGTELGELVDQGHGGRNEERAFIFVSHTGEVYPSGFLPLPAGNVRHRRLEEIYRSSPLFVSLRDTALLKGKCGICEYRDVCGGSRARAYAVSRDPLAEEPLCVYLPAALQTQPHREVPA
ncbi:MAG TPA: TIGR04053 family radical SAM/SPASM domain-containing protein, partial [Thermoanaerobaculia bacterium]